MGFKYATIGKQIDVRKKGVAKVLAPAVQILTGQNESLEVFDALPAIVDKMLFDAQGETL
jgi:hypothetical protein